jgi:CheY-like chemotaxis protein
VAGGLARIRASPGIGRGLPLILGKDGQGAPFTLRMRGRRCRPRVSPDAAGVGPCDDGRVEWTVLIVDDHPGFRSAARALLEADGFDVVGEAADGESGLAAAERLRPGLVLLDIQLPDLDGFAVAERLASAEPAPAVVLISSRAASSYRRRLSGSPALGFVAKSELSGAALSALLASG